MRPFQLFRRVTVALATLAVLVVGWQVGTQRTRSAPERAGHWTRLALAGPLAAPPLFDEIVVFGHSHCDNGNDFILTQGLVVPQPYWGGRFSNGPLWVERLAERLHLGHSTERNPLPAPREAGGTNYAFGGATTGSGYFACVVLADGTEVCLPNVGLQIEMFFADGRTLDGDELIVLHAGDNDASPEIAARNMGEHIAGLAAAGGKWFLVPNMNRISQDPGQRKGREGADQFTAAFNAELDGQLNALEETFDITIFRFDLLGLHDAMINSPAEFGLTNVTDPASPGLTPVPELGAEHPIVPNPDEYMYWDTFHWTRVVHEIVGDAAADQLERTLSLR